MKADAVADVRFMLAPVAMVRFVATSIERDANAEGQPKAVVIAADILVDVLLTAKF